MAAATYQWLADGKEISGATKATLEVTKDLVGKKISVTVTAEDAEKATSKETEAVGEYEALEILSAEQIHKDQVHVTFSAPFSLLDELTVTKGSTEKTIAAVLPDDDKLGATLTMKDALATGTYTVTLTPADVTVDPSSVTFEAEAANKAARIEILGDTLVMKDTNFQEGYCFIKGYNQFDEEITLSGLTVTAAPSSSTQYDSSTGKLTVKSDTANQYAIIKQVTVYAQAMVDSKAVIAQKTLNVSSIGYPAEVEFGEITKDATNVPDISDGISINEINSGLYYIPVLSVKDNYGNDMLAKDLNDLDVKNLLTTVPTSDKSLYFSVRKEGSVFTEKDGQIAIFLGAGNGKPGTFNFLMTSAGGQFEKEVTIKENPFIDTLQVTVPDIYEYEETDEFGLVAYDQDGNELDLYDYLQAGEYPVGKLTFIDKQNLTESQTSIDAGAGNGTWRVQKFADTKTYKVTFVPSNQVKAKGIITFVTTTASFHTETLMATVGARGTSGNISSELKSAASAPYDFNKNLQFLDANGKLMDRAHNVQYPTFVAKGRTVTASLKKTDTINLTDEKIAAANHDDNLANNFGFYYVVSKDDKNVTTDAESVTQNTGADKNGVAPTEGQYYVFLIASQNLGNPAQTRIIDSRTFYVSSGQTGDVPVSYTAKVNNKLYTGTKYADDVSVTVTAKYRNGVTADYAATGLALDGGFTVAGDVISKGSATGDGSTTVSVYLDTVDGLDESGNYKAYTNDGAVATCTLTFSDDDPVGTSVDFKREVQVDANNQNYGTTWKEDETETVWDLNKNSVITVDGGALTMTNGNVAGDTYKMVVKDQYGEEMPDAKYYINGTQVPTTMATVANGAAEKVLEIKGQSKGSEVSKTWRVNVPQGVTVKAVDATVVKKTSSVNVSDAKTLVAALGTAADFDELYVTIDKSTTLDDAIVIPANATLTVPAGVILNSADKNVTINGEFVVNGQWTAGASTVDGTGLISGTGHATLTGTNLAGTVTSTLEGTTLVLKGVTFGGAWSLGGHVELQGNNNFDSKTVELLDGLTLTFANGATATNATALTMDDGAAVTVSLANGTKVTYTADTTSGDPATVGLTASGLTGEDLDAEVSERKMDPIKLSTACLSNGDMSALYDGIALGTPTYTWNDEYKRADYVYTVTGTLNYADSVPGFGSDYHYGLAVTFPSEKDTDAAIWYGAALTEGTYEVTNGWMAEENPTETTFCNGWKADPTTKMFVVEYEYADGSIVNHWVDCSGVTFAAKKTV